MCVFDCCFGVCVICLVCVWLLCVCVWYVYVWSVWLAMCMCVWLFVCVWLLCACVVYVIGVVYVCVCCVCVFDCYVYVWYVWLACVWLLCVCVCVIVMCVYVLCVIGVCSWGRALWSAQTLSCRSVIFLWAEDEEDVCCYLTAAVCPSGTFYTLINQTLKVTHCDWNSELSAARCPSAVCVSFTKADKMSLTVAGKCLFLWQICCFMFT